LSSATGRHDEAGLAVAALGHLLLDPGALYGVQLALAQPSMVTTALPAAALAGSAHERTALRRDGRCRRRRRRRRSRTSVR
jgi:hypothetical protein